MMWGIIFQITTTVLTCWAAIYFDRSLFPRKKKIYGAAGKWISIKDEFPKEGQEIITWNGAFLCTQTNHIYNKQGQLVNYFDRVVTHWQYMPEPPKAKE